jgi:hypothetical protein
MVGSLVLLWQTSMVLKGRHMSVLPLGPPNLAFHSGTTYTVARDPEIDKHGNTPSKWA